MKDKNKKDMIIELLRKEKKLSTSRISALIRASYPRAVELLNQLKKEKKVKINREMMGLSWSLR